MKIPFSALLIILAISAYPQQLNTYTQQLKVGVSGGPSVSRFYPFRNSLVKPHNFKSVLGYHVGVELKWIISEKFSIGVGPNYSVLGGIFEFSSLTFPPFGFGSFESKSAYLEIPLIARVPLFKLLKFSFGSFVAFELNNEVKIKECSDLLFCGGQLNYLFSSTGNDIGITAGVTREFPVGINIGLIFNQGLKGTESDDFFRSNLKLSISYFIKQNKTLQYTNL